MSQKNLSKKVAYKPRSRNSTDNELEEFAKVLADDENAFAVSLEKRALNKSANKKVFSQIKIAFDRANLKAHGIKSLTGPRMEVACHQSGKRTGFIF